MRTWVCAIIINREISIYISGSIFQDMCAVLISSFWHKLSEYVIIITNKYIKMHDVVNYCSLKTL